MDPSGNPNAMIMDPNQQGNFAFGQNWPMPAGPPDGSQMFDQSMGMDLDAEAAARNRGNYRCSKCGEPKKGHVCAFQPMNFKCNRCGNPKKSCTCGAPDTRDMAIQCERDDDMTTRLLDLSKQGVTEFHESVLSHVQTAPY